MKHLRLLLIISMVLLPALCQAADDGYGYPLPGAYGATIIGTPEALKPELPKEINAKRLVLDVIPGMRNRRSSITTKGCAAPSPTRTRRPRWSS